MSQVLRPEDVSLKFGKLFCRGIYTMVDEAAGIARIVEECSAKGPVEWDFMNRRRAGGAITDIHLDGTTLIMDAVIGEREVRFGPASKDLGGQGLKGVAVEGEVVKTTWVGLAGASVGIGACLPQGPGVIESLYPEHAKVGGANKIEVTISTPKMIRAIFAVDDTDTKEKGASWVLMLKAAQEAPVGHMLEHRIVQLNPNVKEKTTQCVAVGVSFAVRERDFDILREHFIAYLKKGTLSENTVLAVMKGLRIPKVVEEYGLRAKREVLTLHDAHRAAREGGVELVEITGPRGAIGAVAGIGCHDMGVRAAGLPEDL